MSRNIQAEIEQIGEERAQTERKGIELTEQLKKVENDIKHLELKVQGLQARGDVAVADEVKKELLEKRREKETTEKEINTLSEQIGKIETKLRDLRQRNADSRKDVEEAARHGTGPDSLNRARQLIAEREKEIETIDRDCKELRAKLRQQVSSGWG